MPSLPPNAFKRALHERRKQVGLWLTLESPVATEVVADSGYDFLLLDMEHTTVTLAQVAAHLTAARGGTAELVVRLPSIDPILVKGLLDAGVRSLMFPFVQTPAEAELAVASTLYPPHGTRGVGGNSRVNRFTRDTNYFSTYAEEQCTIIQVESPQALDAIPEFGKIAALDAIFVGPNDLAANMGLLGKPGDDAVQAKVGDGMRAIRAAGKASGLLDFMADRAHKWLGEGFDFAAVGGDTSLLMRNADSLRQRFRDIAE